jgi:hypothetical protein
VHVEFDARPVARAARSNRRDDAQAREGVDDFASRAVRLTGWLIIAATID